MSSNFFYSATWVNSILEDRWQRYFRCQQNSKKTCAVFDDMEHQQIASIKPYMDRKKRVN